MALAQELKEDSYYSWLFKLSTQKNTNMKMYSDPWQLLPHLYVLCLFLKTESANDEAIKDKHVEMNVECLE